MTIQRSKQAGFTIVELLIVIVVIAILAALVITTFSGIQQKGRDTKRQTDVRALHSMLEAFYAQNGGGYPVLADFNDASWRTTNMKGLDAAALCDPSYKDGNGVHVTENCPLAATPTPNSYSYHTWEADGTTDCANSQAGQVCSKYTLTATLESNPSTYEKKSLN